MNPKEFRIGNYLTTILSNLLRVTMMTDDTIFADDESGSSYDNYAHSLTPIPLTEEWDSKFNFKKTGYQLVCIENNKYAFEMTVEEMGGFSGRRKYFVPVTIVEYVHQVQNLYFDLTGKELEIK